MATKLQILCINKTDRYNPHERIQYVGGLNWNGTRFKISQEQAITYIHNGEFEFFVTVAGREVKVIIAKSAQGNFYIKTSADGEQPNNLLSLPECP